MPLAHAASKGVQPDMAHIMIRQSLLLVSPKSGPLFSCPPSLHWVQRLHAMSKTYISRFSCCSNGIDFSLSDAGSMH